MSEALPVSYGIDERPPWGAAVALAVQHVAAMLLGNITPALIVAGALALGPERTAFLLQMALVMTGIATLVQAYPLGPVGGRIPIVMGTSFAFVAAVIEIGQRWGLPAIFGACLAAAGVEIVAGFGISRLHRFLPPLVTGIVVMLIGLTLIPVGMDYAAGGVGVEDYGSPRHLGLAAVVFVITLGCNRFARGFLRSASILVAVVAGYLLALGLGQVDFAPVARAAWIELPRPLAFGLELRWEAVLLIALIYLVSAVETVGDITGVIAATGREPTPRELRGGLVADGATSALAALFNALPNTSYSQNVGLVNFTGVASRHVTALGGGLLVLMGLVPKVGALFATLPPAVVGGAGLILFAMIFSSGVGIFFRGGGPTPRNLVILAAAVGLGLGVELRPGVLQALPDRLQLLLGSGLLTGGLTAVLLQLLLPERGPGPDPPSHPGGGVRARLNL